ncbi:cAMP-binding protein [Belliella baltica DSM 15883]|uniref:cAMP-binding protein n=1 Tax=Belliella baltica (strain DSM 15883 / CIP 108006 / LMG 21964 / BA134) TaxID=866536 RepID=I3Z3A5_BELBD|nr:cAMP-binding protein [Belliella baltica]AFL83723.1 cAMP-binding protein [Belliella baltica DSM 15883]
MEKEFLEEIKKFCTNISNHFPNSRLPMKKLPWIALKNHLHDKSYPPGEELKSSLERERKSRMILEGLVVAYELIGELDWKIYRVYEEGDIVVDLDSLRSGNPSAIRFQAYTKVRLAELSNKNELLLLKKHPSMNQLSALINQFMYSREAAFAKLLSMSNFEKYNTFLINYRKTAKTLKVQEMAELLNFSISTFKRLRKRKD